MNQANLAVARKQTRRRRAEYLKRYRPKSERERERERKRERGKNGEETKRKGSTRHARRPTIAAAMAAAVVAETSTGQEYLYPYCPGNETRTPSPLTTQMNVPVHTNSCTKGIAFNVGGILGGALAPILALKLADIGGLAYVGLYLGAAALISLIGLAPLRSSAPA